jgi:hypothetical protein
MNERANAFLPGSRLTVEIPIGSLEGPLVGAVQPRIRIAVWSLALFLRGSSCMSATDLRAKIRELMASGLLPEEPPPIVGPASWSWSTPGNKRSRIVIGWNLRGPCTICGEPDPQIQYSYIGGQVVRVHTACDALWQQERAAR